jgi:hypothetical protein
MPLRPFLWFPPPTKLASSKCDKGVLYLRDAGGGTRSSIILEFFCRTACSTPLTAVVRPGTGDVHRATAVRSFFTVAARVCRWVDILYDCCCTIGFVHRHTIKNGQTRWFVCESANPGRERWRLVAHRKGHDSGRASPREGRLLKN